MSHAHASPPSSSLSRTPILSDSRLSFPLLRFSSLSLPPSSTLATLATPAGLIWSPFAALSGVPHLSSPPPRCASCGAHLVSGAVHSGRCVFCGHSADVAAAPVAGGVDPATKRPTAVAAVDTVRFEPVGGERSAAVTAGGSRGGVVVLVDENVGRAREAQVLFQAVRAARNAARACRFALVTYGSGVGVAVLGGGREGGGGGAVRWGAGEVESVTAEQLREMGVEARVRYFARALDDVFVKGGGAGGRGSEKVAEMDEWLKNVLDEALVGRAGRGEEGGTGVRDVEDALDDVSLDDRVGGVGEEHGEGGGLRERVPEAAKVPEKNEPRRLDMALDVALALMDGVVDPENSRILAFVSGPPTLEGDIGAEEGDKGDLFGVDRRSSVASSSAALLEGDMSFPRSSSEFLPRSGASSFVFRSMSMSGKSSGDADVVAPERRNTTAEAPPPASNTWYDSLSTGFGLFASATPSTENGAQASTASGDAEGRRVDVQDPENPTDWDGLHRTSPDVVNNRSPGPPGKARLLSRYEQQDADAAAAKRSSAAAQVFEELGSRAGEARLPIFFLGYAAPLGMAARLLHRAAEGSRGGLVYNSPHGYPTAASVSKAAAHFAAGVSTKPALISIRVSEPFRVARVIGPAVPTAEPETFIVPGTDAAVGFAVKLDMAKSVEEGRHVVDDQGQPSSIPSESSPWPSVSCQLTATTLESTRVTTVQIPIASDNKRYMSTLDPETMAILIGKLAIADAGGVAANSYRFANALDAHAKRLLAVRPPLVHVASMLFYLRRGALVERHGGIGSDEALVLRAMFQRSGVDMSALLMAPRVFSTEIGAAAMTEVDATTAKAVGDEGRAVVIDAGISVFAWIGAAAPSAVEKEVVLAAHDVAAQRGLAHVFVVHSGVEEDEDMLRAYLVPATDVEGAGGVALKNVRQMSFVQYVAMLRRMMLAAGGAAKR